nr:Chain A, Chimallin [Pseudomonas phage 201phi2-1]8IGG_B Chain B, Chimallin [Pseudomonas phage 201phi2-1]8IGG_C Chain C, Chimallin [Pseudomonas phage 201phi2-1]8IGG_E Chain E, Chimallin [Pseudomonas phage 201phi2-1]
MIRDTATNTTQTQAAPQQAPAQQFTQAPQEKPMQSTQSQPTPSYAGTGGINSQFTRSGNVQGGDARASEALTVFTRLKEQAVAQQDLADDFSILRFDRDQHQVGWSSLVIAKQISLNGQPVIAVRPLILPNNSIELPKRKTNIVNGMQTDVIESDIDVGTVFSAQYFNRLSTYVQNTLGKPGAKVVLAGPFPIPADLVLKDSELQLRNLLIKSVNACDDILALHSGERPFTIAGLKGQQGETLAAKVDIRTQPLHDTVGNPIRADIVVTTQRVRRNGQQENEFYETDVKLNQVAMFTNLERTPQAQAQTLFPNQQQVATPAPWVASVVITDVRNADGIQANTPEMYWFALSNAFRSTHGHAWARPFLPMTGVAKDMKDIGALGWMSALRNRIDTKAANFDDAQFGQLMLSQVQPNPVFQIDLNRMGETAQMDSLQLDAAGGPNAQKAAATIIRQINNLGGGGFERFFDHTTQPILERTGQVIDLGNWFDGDEKRDRRDLDNLAALNAAEGNENEFWGFYGAQLNPNLHPDLRNRQSRNYDRQYLGSTVTYTGKAERCTYNAKFIEALDRYLAEAGLQITMDNTSVLNSGQRFMGNSVIGNNMVSGQAQVHSAYAGTQGFNTQYQTGPSSFYALEHHHHHH